LKVTQSFVIQQPQEKLWEFFEQVDEVARCVPGVESVEVVDADNSKVRVTQAVGPMTATFDLKMRVTERQAKERMQFTAVGRAVKGAAGNVRTVNTVTLQPVDEGTQVNLEADLAMGGVLGSVGQKVIAKQADKVTKKFSASLERAINGEPLEEPAAAPRAKPAPGAEPGLAAGPDPTPAASGGDGAKLAAAFFAGVAAALAAVLIFSSRRR
jgi:uncharacterized protein